jgi:hypothetical protein
VRLAVVATSMTAAARSGSRAGAAGAGHGDGQSGDRTPARVPYACADRGDATFALAQVGRVAAATDGVQLVPGWHARLPGSPGVERAELAENTSTGARTMAERSINRRDNPSHVALPLTSSAHMAHHPGTLSRSSRTGRTGEKNRADKSLRRPPDGLVKSVVADKIDENLQNPSDPHSASHRS